MTGSELCAMQNKRIQNNGAYKLRYLFLSITNSLNNTQQNYFLQVQKITIFEFQTPVTVEQLFCDPEIIHALKLIEL